MTARTLGPCTLVFSLAAASCVVPVGGLTARAADEWTRRYPLADKGVVEIENTNGLVEIEGAPGAMVEVRAERIARAMTDAAARQLLPRIAIKEDISPDRVAISTERMEGIVIGVAVEVRYHVRVPKGAAVRVTTTNGRITLGGLDGRVTARTTNGGLSGTALSGGVNARATNGTVSVEMASIGGGKDDSIELRTTNGGIGLKLPVNARADLMASVTNGSISVTGFDIEASEQTRRKVEGRINGGGTPIELSTTNGSIRVGTE